MPNAKHLLWVKQIPNKAKDTIFETYFAVKITYGCEAWNI